MENNTSPKSKQDWYDRLTACVPFRKIAPFLRKYKEVILYLFFGGLAFVLSVGSFALFNQAFRINELLSNIFSWIIAVLFAFFTNRTWVFNASCTDKFQFAKQIASFFLGRVATLAVEELIIYEFITELKFSAILVKIAAQIVVIVLNYVISKWLVFRKKFSANASSVLSAEKPAVPAASSARNYGIDALRMFSMFLVTVLHVLGQGGILSHCEQNGVINWAQYYTAYFFEIAAFGCVDLFGLISGYVGANSKFKPSRFLGVWLQTFFYTMLITVLFAVFSPETIADETGVWYSAVFPIFNQQYWYVTAFFGLFLLTPFLNLGLQKLPEKVLAFVSVISFIAMSLIPTLMKTTLFGMGYGYTTAWLVVMYVIGGTVRRFDCMKKIPSWLGIFVYVFMTFETYHMFRAHPAVSFVQYTSPTILLGAVALLIAFANFKIKRNLSKKFIAYFAPASFGVYLIHVHPLFWKYIMKDFAYNLGFTSTESTGKLLVLVFIACLVIFFAGSFVDVFRISLFSLIRVDKFLKWTDRIFERLILGNAVSRAATAEKVVPAESVAEPVKIEEKAESTENDPAKSIEKVNENNII